MFRLIPLIVIVFLISSCAGESTSQAAATPSEVIHPQSPANAMNPSQDTPENPNTPQAGNGTLQPGSSDNPYAPKSGDSTLQPGNVYLDSASLLTQGSAPVQNILNLKGNLPDPCHQLRISINPPDVKNQIQVEVYSVSDASQICVQILKPFEANVTLGRFPSGHYSVWVNEKKVAEFDS